MEVLITCTPQEREETKKSTSKDNEVVLSGRDKRLAEQVTSYNVSVIASCFLLLHFLPVFTLSFLFLFLLAQLLYMVMPLRSRLGPKPTVKSLGHVPLSYMTDGLTNPELLEYCLKCLLLYFLSVLPL